EAARLDRLHHQVELSKGGFGAQYGGRLSSILNVTNLDGNREEFEGSAAISIISGKTTLQMPIGDFGSISGSFRRTYWDKTVARAIKDIPNYYFYDGHLKAFFDIDGKNKLTISAYGGEDVLHYIFNEDAEEKAGFNYDWGNTTGSIRWTRVFSPQLFANFWVTGSRFESSWESVETVDYLEENFISDITFKGNLEFHHSKKFITNFGFEQKNLHAIYKRDFDILKIDGDKRPRHYIAFIQNSWRPNVRWDIETGLRYNFFDNDESYSRWAPRISAKYRLTSSINLKAAGGKYYQFLHKIPLTFIADIWFASNKYQKPSSSYHAIFGFQKDFHNTYQLEVETFYKTYHNTYSYNHNYITELKVDHFENGKPVYTETRGVFNRGDGHSSGFELLLRKDMGAVTGWIGYSLAFTKYKIDGINQGKEFAPRHDKNSVLNVVSTIDIKNLFRSFRGKSPVKHRSNWKLGLTFVYSTGQPITTPGSAYFVNALPDHNGDKIFDTWRYERFPSEINSYRLPPYARLDVSLTYEKHFRGWSIFPYIQVFNVGNRKNVWFVEYELDDFVQKVDPKHMIPILPTIGVNFKF
ncbi:MAG: TonB-dependent receptor plug domain-containing protein, partial [bacterium]